MAQDDPEELAQKLEREAEELARRSQELQGKVEQTRQGWERKRADGSVPGAPPAQKHAADGGGSPAPEAPPKSDGG